MHYPITALQPGDAARVEAHLLRLSSEDRSLRFAAGLVTDDTIRRYVRGLRFGQDLALGLVSQCGLVFGFAHGGIHAAGGERRVEVAFSVDAAWRRRGCGTALMQAVRRHAAAREHTALVGCCAARNLPMRSIFQRSGMALTRDDDEIRAYGRVAEMHRWQPAAALAR